LQKFAGVRQKLADHLPTVLKMLRLAKRLNVHTNTPMLARGVFEWGDEGKLEKERHPLD
jgi:hypothetical protein